MIYKWTDGSRFNADPQVVGELIETLTESHGGTITAEIIVDAATANTSPLHTLFEWDDERAASQYRLSIARKVLHAIVVTSEQIAEPTRAFVHLYASQPEYRPIALVLSDDDLRERLLANALSELRNLKKRYGHLKQLADVFTAAEVVEQRQGLSGHDESRPGMAGSP